MANGFLINCFSSLPAWPALGEIKEKGRLSFLLQDEQNFTLDYANFSFFCAFLCSIGRVFLFAYFTISINVAEKFFFV